MEATASTRDVPRASDERGSAGTPSGTAQPQGPARIEAVHVTKTFGEGDGAFIALGGVELAIHPESFVCLVGPSGCGKSTLLNLIAGLSRPTDGWVEYDGKPIRGVNSQVGYITQNDNLLPWRTLQKNVELGLEVRGYPKAERRDMARQMIQQVGLDGFEERYPAQLSGGMRKRATLARNLVYGPETLLMDEPFGAVDAQMRLILHQDLMTLWERDRKTVVFVTHDLEEALTLADRIVVMGTNPGRVIHMETVPFERPRDAFSLRSDPRFVAALGRLWKVLGGEMKRTVEDDRSRRLRST